jgi:HEAT repeat protein
MLFRPDGTRKQKRFAGFLHEGGTMRTDRLLTVPALFAKAAKVILAGVCVLLVAGTGLAQAPADKAWTTLQGGLADKGVDNRAVAVRLLGLIENNPKAEEFALKALADEKPDVRAAAADALGQMKAKSAVPKLTELAKSEKDVSVILACGRSLIALGDPLGFNVFYAVLTGERKSGAGLGADQKKMLSDPKKMAQFGFEQGIGYVPFGGVGYGTFKAVTKDDASPVRAAAAKILAKDPDPKSSEALVAAASDKSWIVRAAALDAISHRDDPSLSAQIEPRLNDEKEAVRYTAAAAIIHLADVGSTR